MHRTTTLLALFLSTSITGFAQIIPNRYIVELTGEPAATFAARQGHKPHARDAVFQSRAAQIRGQHQAMRTALEQAGAVVTGTTHAVLNSMLVRIPDAQAARLASLPGVKRVHPVRLYQMTLDRALPLHHVPDAWTQIGGQDNAGLGVKIAIIDTGIDSSHPAFQDTSLPIPDGFPKVNQDSDLAFTNNRIIVARSYSDTAQVPPAKDVEGHGTGVAMTAGGGTTTGPYGIITGVAPKAYLGNYKVFPGSGGAPDDLIIRAIDDAVSDGMDVLNLSLGTVVAPRPQDDAVVQAVENAVFAGKIVTVAAGNSGPDPNTIGSPGTSPHAISVGSMSNDRIFTGSIRFGDGAVAQAIPGAGANSANPITAPVVDVAAFDPSGLACGSLPAGSLSGSIALILRGTCTFEQKINNAANAGAAVALIYATSASPDAINMAVGAATLPASMVSNQTGTALKQLAGTGAAVTIAFTLGPVSVNPDRMSGYSARGPNSDSAIKPDLIAVGESIYTAKPVANDGSTTDGYVIESGTSFSSPMVAGAAALLKAARPGLTAAQYRSLLVNSTAAFDTPATIQQTGSGLLNLAAALQTTIAAAPTSLSFGFGGGTVDNTSILTLTNLGTASDTFAISGAPMNGTIAPVVSTSSVTLDPGQSQDVTVQFTNRGLAPGAYQGYITVQGNQGAVVARIPYWYAAGSNTAANVTILDAPTAAKPNSSQTIVFRITDSEGIPVSQQPNISFTAGNGLVRSIVSIDSNIPGAYQATVRMGAAGTNTIRIGAGGVTHDLPVQVSASAP